jgi:hypothetical protein
MSIEAAAKELSRTFTTAGLSKDVIDLLEKKLALLTQQVALLDAENARLKLENGQLRAQTANPKQGAFQESMGVLWKRTASGFEPNPYCNECASHPPMFPQPPVGTILYWNCSRSHTVSGNVRPPQP